MKLAALGVRAVAVVLTTLLVVLPLHLVKVMLVGLAVQLLTPIGEVVEAVLAL
jgi:hypothetical protein